MEQRALSADINERVAKLEEQLRLLRHPVVRGGDILPPVGVIGDYLDDIADQDAVARARRDFLPIPHSENRERYAENRHAAYWLSGLEDYDKVIAACERAGIRGGRYYDFGGSTGRVFRHFYCQGRQFEVWSSDYQTASFRWNQEYMPPDIRVFLSGVAPPLPIRDGHFDVVTAFSVFTHIDELESPWLLEMHRILKPGGLLYATIHDEMFWQHKPLETLRAINFSPNGADVTGDTAFPGERVAYHWTEGSYYSSNVFHPTDYIRREWGRLFDIVDIRPLAHGNQCVVLLTPR